MTSQVMHHGTHSVTPATNRWRRIGAALGRGLRHLQYARMVRALNEIPDAQLAEAGLRRDEIQARARRLIYGDR